MRHPRPKPDVVGGEPVLRGPGFDPPEGHDPRAPWPGGPRALTPRLGWWWAAAALWALGLVFLVGVGRLLVGGVLFAGGFFAAAAIRAVTPPDDGDGLHVRTRVTDVLVDVLAGSAVLAAVVLVLLRYSS